MIQFAPISMSSASSPMHTASEHSVRQSSHSSGQLSGICRAVVVDRVNTFLRKLHPTNTADNVAADTGIPSATVEKWLVRQSAPSLPAFLTLFDVYDANFLAAVSPRLFGWLDDAARAQKQAALDARIAELQAERERLR